MPQTATSKLTEKTRGFLIDQYHYKQLLDDPKKVVDLYDTYYKLWARLPNNGSFQYAKPFLEKIVEENGRQIDYSSKLLNVLSFRYPQLKPAGSLIEIAKLYGGSQGQDRTELGKKILKEDVNGSIYKMLQQIPSLEGAMGEIIRDNQNLTNGTNFTNAALDNIILLGHFNSSLDTPTSDEELILKAPVNSLQVLLSETIKSAIDRADIEGKENYEAILEEELRKQGTDIENLNEKLTEYFNKVLDENIKKKKSEEISFQMNEARGWGSIVGSIVGINNPKLGSLITDGSKAIVDSYEAFSLIANVGFSAATFATGVGGVMTVMSMINAFQNDEQDQTQLLFDGLNKINENINNLREEVHKISENVIYLIDQVDYLIQNTSSKLAGIEDIINILIDKVDEYNKLNLDSDFEDILNEIKKIKFKSTPFSFITELDKLYNLGVIDATKSKFTRLKDSTNSNYDFLSLKTIVEYDSFYWSPIEKRPYLIENLRSFFLASKETESDKDFWLSELPSIKSYLTEDSEFINPIITSKAFDKYSEIIRNYFLYCCSEKDYAYNEVILNRINDFYSVFSWFNKITFGLSSEKVIKLTLEKYLSDALDLLDSIIHINKAKLYRYTIENNIKPKIQLDAFRLNAISTKFEDSLSFQQMTFGENENYLQNFFSFSINLEIPFDFKTTFLLTPPFLSTIKHIVNQPKIDELNKHFDKIMNNCPDEINHFIYLLGFYYRMGVLSIEKEYYIGSSLININDNHVLNGSPKFGELTIKYIFTIDNKKSSINLVNKSITIIVIDTNLGFNSSEIPHNQVGSYSQYLFPKSIGNGSIMLNHDLGANLSFLPPSIFNEELFSKIDKIFVSDNITSFKETLSNFKSNGIYVGISTKDEFSAEMKTDSQLLNDKFIVTRNSWINLTTAVLCHSESNLDTSLYFELLDRKPKLLDTSVSMSDDNSINYTIGENLSDLLLLWINQDKDENKNRIPFKGINVRGGIENQDVLKEEFTLPTLWLNFDENDKDNPISYELYRPQFEQMLKNIINPKNCVFYGSILPNCDNSINEITKLYSYFYLQV